MAKHLNPLKNVLKNVLRNKNIKITIYKENEYIKFNKS